MIAATGAGAARVTGGPWPSWPRGPLMRVTPAAASRAPFCTSQSAGSGQFQRAEPASGRVL